jgi:hypothetical protein
MEFFAFPVVAARLIQRSVWGFDSLCLLFECVGQPWIAIVLSRNLMRRSLVKEKIDSVAM